MHFLWCVGAAIGPFTIHPFLPDLGFMKNTSCFHNESISLHATNGTGQSLSNELNASVVCDLLYEEIREKVKTVQFAYIITAAVNMAPGGIFGIAFFLNAPSFFDRLSRIQNEPEEVKKSGIIHLKGRSATLGFLFLSFGIYVMHGVAEYTISQFIAPFVVKGLGFPNGHGSHITSLFWGATLVGCALGIVLAIWVKPRNIIIGDLVLLGSGITLMLFSGYDFSIVWIATVISGLGLSTFYGSVMLFVADHIEVTGKRAGLLLFGGGVGGFVGPFLSGLLIEWHYHMGMVYVMLASSVLLILLFAVTNVYVDSVSKKSKNYVPDSNKGIALGGPIEETLHHSEGVSG